MDSLKELLCWEFESGEAYRTPEQLNCLKTISFWKMRGF
jgi:hypothetical protein